MQVVVFKIFKNYPTAICVDIKGRHRCKEQKAETRERTAVLYKSRSVPSDGDTSDDSDFRIRGSDSDSHLTPISGVRCAFSMHQLLQYKQEGLTLQLLLVYTADWANAKLLNHTLDFAQ